MARMVIDGHCDAILPVLGRSLVPGETEARDFFAVSGRAQIDFPSLLQGGVAVQSMALFLDDCYLPSGPRAETFRMLEALEALYEKSEGRLFPYRGAEDARRAHVRGGVASLFAIEGGEALEGSLDTLSDFAARGLKLLGLTWNRENELGRGVRASGRGGLKPFGRKVVAECERLGVIVDASHLSDEAFDDLSACAERPFVASHANCRAVCGDLRNLDDGRIEALAASGGLIGITFVPQFVSGEGVAAGLEAILAHVDHAVSVAGVEHVGFGSDFDGYPPCEGDFMEGARSWPGLADALVAHGYSEAETEALLGGNWLRILSQLG